MKLDLKTKIRSPFFWLAICMALSLIFAFTFKITGIHTFYVLTFAMWIYPVLLTLLGLGYIFFVAPAIWIIKKIKKKREE